MKTVVIVLLAAVLVAADISVLFIGNSFTFQNDLPNMLKELSADAGVPISVLSHFEGGAPLCTLVSHQNAKTLLSRKHDYVVLQDQSNFPMERNWRAASIRCLNEEYKPRLVQAGTSHVIFYETWGRRKFQFLFPDFPSNQRGLTEGYNKYAENMAANSTINVQVARVGSAFLQIYNESQPNFLSQSSAFYRLYDSDDSHPSALGTYIAACSMYMRITGRSPVGIKYKPAGMSNEDRNYIQGVVARFLDQY
jgi:hypothetical protein